ncbi:PadR family transcriptional regulator [Actinomadura sp. ATCC 39365]|uniref:PadR family transcriptional regulator n=1 Tax=Nonomuraea sp. NPDC005692 TaxID=3157168 RepID=UPI0033FD38FD
MRNDHERDMDARLRKSQRELAAELSQELDLDAILASVQARSAEIRAALNVPAKAAIWISLGPATISIGRYFRQNAEETLDDLTICKDLGLPPSTIYPVIRQFVEAGWVEERWESGVPEGQPRRKLYRLTAEGPRGIGEMTAYLEQQKAGAFLTGGLLHRSLTEGT